MELNVGRSDFVVRVILGLTLAWAINALGLAAYNLFFHPLSKFPGPLRRCAFTLPSVFEVWSGRSIRNTLALHEKYGSVVRTGPDALSFSSAQAWRDIYGFQQDRRQIPKDYKRAPDVPDALPILFSSDVDHARMRRLMSHAFSEAALREQLPLLAQHMRLFISQLRAQADRGVQNKVDLNAWFNYLAFDVVTDLSFGEPLGALMRGTPDPYIEGFFRACRMFIVIPLMHEYFLFKALFKLMMKVPSIRRSQEMGYLATKSKVEKRLNANTDRKDFMTYIIRHNDDRGMSSAEIIGSTTVLVNAGGEATAACMGAAVYYMLRNRHVYDKAREEVRTVFRSPEAITSTTSHDLTYLRAIVDEVFRIYAPAPGSFARRTNAPTQIDGHIVPANTSVGVHQYSAGRSSDNFMEPEHFMPERWLNTSPSECERDSKAAVQPWAIGPRACLGKNLACLEIRTALALLLWHFEIELCQESHQWPDEQTYNIVWNRGPLYVRILPRDA